MCSTRLQDRTQLNFKRFSAYYFSLAAIGGTRVSFIPSVLRTVSTLPNWQVGLPFSRSMMKRRPVLEVRAKSLCLTRIPFRAFLTASPTCLGLYFMGLHIITEREYCALIHGKDNKILPSGNILRKFSTNVPERER